MSTPSAADPNLWPLARWFWMNDHKGWSKYDQNTSNQIEASLMRGDPSLPLFHNKYTLSITHRYQANNGTEFKRPVIRATWFFLDDEGHFQPLDERLAAKLDYHYMRQSFGSKIDHGDGARYSVLSPNGTATQFRIGGNPKGRPLRRGYNGFGVPPTASHPPQPPEQIYQLPKRRHHSHSHASSHRTLMEGLLEKKGRTHTWNLRYFFLTGSVLAYRRDRYDGEVREAIPVGQIYRAYVAPMSKKNVAANIFYVCTPARDYCLRAVSNGQAQQWVASIESLIGGKKKKTTKKSGRRRSSSSSSSPSPHPNTLSVGGEKKKGVKSAPSSPPQSINGVSRRMADMSLQPSARNAKNKSQGTSPRKETPEVIVNPFALTPSSPAPVHHPRNEIPQDALKQGGMPSQFISSPTQDSNVMAQFANFEGQKMPQQMNQHNSFSPNSNSNFPSSQQNAFLPQQQNAFPPQQQQSYPSQQQQNAFLPQQNAFPPQQQNASGFGSVGMPSSTPQQSKSPSDTRGPLTESTAQKPLFNPFLDS